MRYFAAQYVYVGQGKLLKKQALGLDESGIIKSIEPFEGETASTEFLNGILCAVFGQPGNGKHQNPEEATSLLHRIWETNKSHPIIDLLDSYTTAPNLRIGSKSTLWCIEPVDLENLFLKEDSFVYSVFS